MYCTCSNKNNYEVIGLCDVNTFTKKLGPFHNRPWTEITIPAISTLDCNNIGIEAIQKVYVNVFITSTKIIDTPESPRVNSEGLTLTGKKLLIDGYVCENIVYTALTESQNINTISFNLPFCTFIVIEGNTDIFNDTYCVKYCIEDVFISLIDCKTLFQNITLFLYAQKTAITCPSNQPPKLDCTVNPIIPIPSSINKLKNSILINNNSDANVEVAKIEFDKDNEEFLVTSTGRVADPSGGGNTFFTLALKDSNNEYEKFSNSIISSLNADNFKSDLNGQSFQYGDVLELNYTVPNKVSVTNFPDEGQTHIPNINVEHFKITPEGLIAYNPMPVEVDLTNTIIVRGKSGTVSTIKFDGNNKQLVITSYKVIPNDTIKDITYFSLKLKDNNNRNVKASSTILTNENSENFKNTLNGQNFQFNDILELYYLDAKQILILDYPEKGRRHTPTVNKEYYRITPRGLAPYTPPGPSPTSLTLPNEIIIKANTGEESSRILFDITNNVFLVKPTYKTPYIEAGDGEYFNIKLRDENTQETKKEVSFISNSSGEDFFNNLNNSPFELGNFIELNYFSPQSINITNYPNGGSLHTPTKQIEYYEITSTGLVSYTPPTPVIPPTVTTLPNTIKIKGNNGNDVANIQFDSGNKRFLISSTSEIPNYSEGIKEYFIIKLRNGTSKKVKAYSFITCNAKAKNLEYDFNYFPFEIGDIIELYYLQPNSIEISDIPSTGQTHIPNNNKESYTITNNGLVAFTGDLNIPISNIIVNSKADNEVVNIQLAANNKFDVSATGEIPDTDPSATNTEYLAFLSQKNSGLINFTSKFNSGEIADGFAREVNEKSFDDLDYLSLSYADKSKIQISNFEGEASYTPNKNNEQVVIDNRPALKNNFRIVNTLLLVNDNNEVIATIQFNKLTKRLIVLSTNVQTTEKDFWTITLSDSFRNLISNFTLEQNRKGDAFADKFNGLKFEYGYQIVISVHNKTVSTLTVTNFENKIVNKLPPIDSDISLYSFKITSNGLIRVNN
ncbi:SPOCS domain-containing protein [Clostridium tarantellae]|uniref:DUF3794 domain-containing protein n=1 Tax=Clostridium tarantellae TaxID=39493 RepID=A0A6I1MPY6_9CLOT|nr:SPOCS domain-containing protein [Clostridium tarantellae]MPQ44197.1 DUF3794 domain-containing protein [Clostridium tarantellae]